MNATREQVIMLQKLWGRAKDSLKVPGKNDRERRLNWTETVLKRRVESWSDLRRKNDVDDLKAALLAIIEPDNLDAQLQQLRQKHNRAIWRIDQLCVEMGKNRNFVNGVAQQIEDGLDPNNPSEAWQHERERDSGRRRKVDELTVPELKKVIAALRSIKKRAPKATTQSDLKSVQLDGFAR